MDKEYLIKAVRKTIRLHKDCEHINAQHLAKIIMETASLYLDDGGLDIRLKIMKILPKVQS
tara:strand:+ start:39 stop:221 length:183 start_codon:yes stop_codon:yes gene_type:complete